MYIFKNIYMYKYINITTVNQKRGHKFESKQGGYVGLFVGRKREG